MERDKSGQSLALLSNAAAIWDQLMGAGSATADKEPEQIYFPIRSKEWAGEESRCYSSFPGPLLGWLSQLLHLTHTWTERHNQTELNLVICMVGSFDPPPKLSTGTAVKRCSTKPNDTMGL